MVTVSEKNTSDFLTLFGIGKWRIGLKWTNRLKCHSYCFRNFFKNNLFLKIFNIKFFSKSSFKWDKRFCFYCRSLIVFLWTKAVAQRSSREKVFWIFKWQQQDSNPQPVSLYTNTQPFIQLFKSNWLNGWVFF